MKLSLPTKTKLYIAKILFYLAKPLLSLLGFNIESLKVKRQEILWQLDLREGIDFSIFLLGGFELQSQNALRKLVSPGDTVLDIGANIGAYSLPLAKMVGPSGHVLAVEPTDWAFKKLNVNLSINPELSKQITAKQVGLISKDSKPPTDLAASWRIESVAADSDWGATLQSTSGSEFQTLDEFLAALKWPKVSLVKLDVDGYELEVLKGAEQFFRDQSPKILIELAPHVLEEFGTSLEDLITYLQERGYSFYYLSGKPLPKEAANILKLIPHKGSLNVLALSEQFSQN